MRSVSEQDARYPISDTQVNASTCLSDWRPVDRCPQDITLVQLASYVCMQQREIQLGCSFGRVNSVFW